MTRATWVALVVVALLTSCTDPTVPDEALVDVSLTSSKSEIAVGEATVCDDIALSEVLEPGDSLYRTVSFDGTGWLTLDGPTIPAPGDYELRAGLSLEFAYTSERVGLRIAAPTEFLLLEPTRQ